MTGPGSATGPAALGDAAARLLERGLPEPVDAWARDALLDAIAVTVGGVRTRVARAALAVAARRPGPTALRIVPGHTTPEWAALVWATAGNALDYDDGHVRGGGIHAGTTVAAALLATAPNALPLERLRTAFVIGCEIAVTAGGLASPERSGHDYRTSGYAAAIGAAAAVAAVLPLPAEPSRRQGSVRPAPEAGAALEPSVDLDLPAPPVDRAGLIAATIRLATAHAPIASFVSGGARESTGWAAATAVSTAELAAAGLAPQEEEGRVVIPAGATLFDRGAGQGAVGPAAPDPVAPDTAAAFGLDFGGGLCDPARPFAVLETYRKPYPCCRAAHAAIDAVLDLVDNGALAADGEEAIEVGLPSATLGLDERDPRDLGEAQFAIPFLVGLVVSRGRAGLRGLGRVPLRELVQDSLIRRVIDRVRLVHDPALERDPGPGYPASVVTSGVGGQAESAPERRTVRDALGSPERPLSDGELRDKALDLLRPELGDAASAALVDLCVHPRANASVGDLREALTPHSNAAAVAEP